MKYYQKVNIQIRLKTFTGPGLIMIGESGLQKKHLFEDSLGHWAAALQASAIKLP